MKITTLENSNNNIVGSHNIKSEGNVFVFNCDPVAQREKEIREHHQTIFEHHCSIQFKVIFQYISEKYGTSPADIQDFIDNFREIDVEYDCWRKDRIRGPKTIAADDRNENWSNLAK